jgi:hypothetical protein
MTLLSPHVATIRILAKQLRARGALTGADVDRLLRGASERGES